ncbi:glucuronate isomerase [Chitinophaga ginsengisegetis]|uniref:glucuronate isomerase n=1 Tax=Chitinophaga ginsengisegetis TaxID=393003 RepID=UPI000DBA4EC1|nr:glucuronate isomerase [Chitinophaga ginsengisegetis]MDR6568931.1 glucuronate isomerase [Chitinophaga ginsengisegetis]MDR6649040.1 glucuronate isomerase [Chitinophaga ginsengisegetis]MDR6655012.1 glucuronate isomerase [Chitinophaga ginsengisegetis]
MRKKFMDENFLLNSDAAERLYHDYAKDMPIIDYHCHLPPAQIAADTRFENITQAWLYGDHYKWRAMRTNGVPESYCTGNNTDWEKFEKWAATVPYTLRNPLHHWTHLELQRYFGISDILNPASAKQIYDSCNQLLQTPEYSVQNLLRSRNVSLICTTDDPADNLQYHRQLKQDGFEIPVVPAFRPDQAMNVDVPEAYNRYLEKLEQAANCSISTYDDLLQTLKNRHDVFAAHGCKVSDHGIEEIYADDFLEKDIRQIFLKIRGGQVLTYTESRQFKSALLLELALMDWKAGWVQQYHLGALRNNNSRMLRQLGPDTGWDSIGDFSQARALAKFLDKLDSQDKLAKTIIYNLNPADNELMATMTGNFNDGSVAGKVQFGAAWWFLDQKDGMTRQMNALSNMGLISRFVGMLTDSRSFLSYPRHEYFRRLLCDLFGEEIERGEIPDDIEAVGKMIQDICYGNAKSYFGW